MARRVEELADVGRRLAGGEGDSLDLTSRLATIFLDQLATKYKEELASEEEEVVAECLALSSLLSEEQVATMGKALCVVFTSELHQEIFFRPLEGLSLGPPVALSPTHPRLLATFEQRYLDMDLMAASLLVFFDDLINCDSLLRNLSVAHFYTLQHLLELEASRRPHLSPVTLQQIDEHNVAECSNFLASYSGLSPLTLLRYLVHLARLDAECALLVVQAHGHALPPPAILLMVLSYEEAVQEAASTSEQELGEGVEQEVAVFLARSLAAHLPAWGAAWRAAMELHPGLLTLATTAFRAANEARLGRVASMVGAHRAAEGLELAPLGDFLLRQLGEEEEEVEWCRGALYLPGLVRALLRRPELAEGELGLVVELGDLALARDLGLLGPGLAPRLVAHMATVYKDCAAPLAWEGVALALLGSLGARATGALLLQAAPSLQPATLSRR